MVLLTLSPYRPRVAGGGGYAERRQELDHVGYPASVGQPMYPPPPAEPRRGHTLRTVLIIVGVVAVLCCGGAITGGVVLFKSIQNATGPARTSVETFLGQLEAGQTDAAYQNLCSATRSRFTVEQFTQIVNARPRPRSYSIVSTNVSNYNGRVSASVDAALHYADGSSDNHRFQLVKESGNWRVCGQPY